MKLYCKYDYATTMLMESSISGKEVKKGEDGRRRMNKNLFAL